MMTLQINCDECLIYSEMATRHESPCSDIDREVGPGWKHLGDKNYCPSCAARRGL